MSLLKHYHIRLEELEGTRSKNSVQLPKYNVQGSVKNIARDRKSYSKDYGCFQLEKSKKQESSKDKIHQRSLVDNSENTEIRRNYTLGQKQESLAEQSRNVNCTEFSKSHTRLKFEDKKYLNDDKRYLNDDRKYISENMNKTGNHFVVKRNLVINEEDLQKHPTQVIQDIEFEKQKVKLFDSQIKLAFLKDKHKQNSQRLNRNYHLNYLTIKENEKNKDGIHVMQKQMKDIKYKQYVVDKRIEEIKETNAKLINYNNDRMQQIEELEFDRKQSQDTAKNNELAIIKLNKQYLKNKKNNKLMQQHKIKLDKMLQTYEQKLLKLEYEKQNCNQRLKK